MKVSLEKVIKESVNEVLIKAGASTFAYALARTVTQISGVSFAVLGVSSFVVSCGVTFGFSMIFLTASVAAKHLFLNYSGPLLEKAPPKVQEILKNSKTNQKWLYVGAKVVLITVTVVTVSLLAFSAGLPLTIMQLTLLAILSLMADFAIDFFLKQESPAPKTSPVIASVK